MDGPTCSTPWRHSDKAERPAVLAVTLDELDRREFCLDCAADAVRVVVADVRHAQITGTPKARATVELGPVMT